MTKITLEELKAGLKKIYVHRPVAKKVFELFDYCRDSITYDTEPQCALILGDTGVGKTRIFKEYLYRNPIYYELSSRRLQRPVARIRMPTNRSMRNVGRRLLKSLEFQGHDKIRKDVDGLFDAAVTQIEKQAVSLVIIDEFQHVTEKNASNVLRGASDLFKNFAKEDEEDVCVPLALGGKPGIKSILSNDQFERLFCHRILIPHFTNTQKGTLEFIAFLKSVDEQLPYCPNFGLAEPKMAQKIFAAGGGKMNFTMRLIRTAIINAYLDNSTPDDKHFAKVYDIFLKKHFPKQKNPFK